MTNGDDINPEQIARILEDATLGGADAQQARVVSAETRSSGELLRMRVEEEDSGLIRWDVQTQQLETLAAAISGAMPFHDRVRAAVRELYAEGAGSRSPVTEPETRETPAQAPGDTEAAPPQPWDWTPSAAPPSYTRDTSPGPGDPDLDL